VPYLHDISTRIRGRRASLRYWIERAGRFPIPRVHQEDEHSCGFLAALVVAQYFDPTVSARDVLAAVPKNWLPSPTRGLSEYGVRKTLSRFRIECPNREGLGWRKLLRLTTEGAPVIVTVLPEGWDFDHWVVIRGMTSRHVWVSNYAYADDGRLTRRQFSDMWYPYGEAMVCRRV